MIIGFFLVCAFLFPLSEASAALLLGRNDLKKKSVSSDDNPWLITYYVGYQNEYLKPQHVDYSLMTHIVVGGVGVRADGTLNEHWHLKNGEGRAMALDVNRRAKRAGVKTLIWLGGPNEEDLFYSATSDLNRKTFVKNILALIEELGYDGVDIDWEPIRKQDEERVLQLVKDLRTANPDVLITIPINWVPSSILFKKDLSVYRDIARYVDKLFVMSYSMAGPWPGWESWHGSALGGDGAGTPASIRTSLYAYRRAGVPEKKLGLGIGTYATCWEYPVTRPRQVLSSSFYPRNMRVMSMRTMMEEYYSKRYERWDATAKVPYLSFPKAVGDFKCGFVSYENERSIKEKVNYANRIGLGGVMVWNIGTGYFPDSSTSKKHILLKTAQKNLR